MSVEKTGNGFPAWVGAAIGVVFLAVTLPTAALIAAAAAKKGWLMYECIYIPQ